MTVLRMIAREKISETHYRSYFGAVSAYDIVLAHLRERRDYYDSAISLLEQVRPIVAPPPLVQSEPVEEK